MPTGHNEIDDDPEACKARQSVLLLHTGAPEAASEMVDIAVLTSFAAAQMEGEPDLIVELIDLYLEDAPRRIADLQAAIAGADQLALKRTAHSLRGSSANLGARQVAALCAELEYLDDSDTWQRGSALLTRLAQAFAHVQQAFTAERQRRS